MDGTFIADYAIPDGPAVTFDARAVYEWLHGPGEISGRTRMHDYAIDPELYDPEWHRPADWLYRLLVAATSPMDGWRLADGVTVDVEETIDSDDAVDGSAVLVVSVGGVRLASHHIGPEEFTSGTYGPAGEPITQIEAVLQSLAWAADVVNRMVEEHRLVRAAATRPGPLSCRFPDVDVEAALVTLAELVRRGVLDQHADILSARQREVATRVNDGYEDVLGAQLDDED